MAAGRKRGGRLQVDGLALADGAGKQERQPGQPRTGPFSKKAAHAAARSCRAGSAVHTAARAAARAAGCCRMTGQGMRLPGWRALAATL